MNPALVVKESTPLPQGETTTPGAEATLPEASVVEDK
jgi:hypothetical protein